jgi:RNA polymerase sigma-70 factor (ECF subfamily)
VGIFSGESEKIDKRPVSRVSYNVDDGDAVFIMRCLAGNTDAFGVIVTRHQDKMLNMAYRITSDYQEALDAVQDAFLTAYKNLAKFKGESLFSTWLASIVINQAKNRVRKKGRLKRHECSSIDDPLINEKGSIAIEPADRGPTPLDSLQKNELDMKVQECIGALDEDQRVVLVLREIEEYAYEEIGGMLGLPDGTVRSRLFRARALLKECLKKIMGGFK